MSRETSVIVLDVSPRISEDEFKNVLAAGRYLVEGKLSNFPKDELGLIFTGTVETRNAYQNEPGYEHHTEAQELLPVAAIGMRALRTLLAPLARASGADLFSALLLAVDMLATRVGNRRKNATDTQLMVLVTSGAELVEMPDDATFAGMIKMCVDLNMYVPL